MAVESGPVQPDQKTREPHDHQILIIDWMGKLFLREDFQHTPRLLRGGVAWIKHLVGVTIVDSCSFSANMHAIRYFLAT